MKRGKISDLAFAAETEAALRVIFAHELRSRPRVRCLVASPADQRVQRARHGEDPALAARSRLRRN